MIKRKLLQDSNRNATLDQPNQQSYINSKFKDNPNNTNNMNHLYNADSIPTENNYLISHPHTKTDRELLCDRDPINNENILIEMKKLQKLEK